MSEPLTREERDDVLICWGHYHGGDNLYRYEATVQAVEKREADLLNYIGADWCPRCGGSGNGPTQYDGGACVGCGGEGLVRRPRRPQRPGDGSMSDLRKLAEAAGGPTGRWWSSDQLEVVYGIAFNDACYIAATVPQTIIALIDAVQGAMHLVENGERAPGGDETWDEWYARARDTIEKIL